MDNSHELHPSVERRIAGQHRLNIVRLDAYLGRGLGAEGTPMLRVNGGSGSSASGAHGVPFATLAAACDAFNAVIAGEAPLPDPDPVAERHRRNRVADAISYRVRELVLEQGL